MNMKRFLPALVRTSAILLTAAAIVAGSSAFAQRGAGGDATCQRLQDSRYWPIAYQIAPMPDPEPRATQRALDGFTVSTTENEDGTLEVALSVIGRSGSTTISVDPASQVLYFLEGEDGDDSYQRDTDLGDETVVLTDLQGCIEQN